MYRRYTQYVYGSMDCTRIVFEEKNYLYFPVTIINIYIHILCVRMYEPLVWKMFGLLFVAAGRVVN